MREAGKSYREIRKVLGVSKSTLSLWLRDIPLTEEQQQALARRGRQAASARGEANRQLAARRRARIQAQARAQIAPLSESELFVAGVVAYWAEGTKNKPWRFGQGVLFINSDPGLIALFLAWLDLVGVARECLRFRLLIHESADENRSKRFWADLVGAPLEVFGRTTYKAHNPKTVRHNVGDDYHGCLAIYVRRSAELNLQIAGWCEGITMITSGTVERSGVV